MLVVLIPNESVLSYERDEKMYQILGGWFLADHLCVIIMAIWIFSGDAPICLHE